LHEVNRRKKWLKMCSTSANKKNAQSRQSPIGRKFAQSGHSDSRRWRCDQHKETIKCLFSLLEVFAREKNKSSSPGSVVLCSRLSQHYRRSWVRISPGVFRTLCIAMLSM
jgi:hypothetical protein